MTTQTRQKDLIAKAMNLIAIAQTIDARYPDPTKIPAEAAKKMSELLTEARRLKNLADLAKQKDDLESWQAEPDKIPDALAAEAAMQKAGIEGEHYTKALRRHEVDLFIKAIRMNNNQRDA